MRKTVLIVISVMCFLIGRSQTELLIYNSANIADSLKENANAVLRLDEARLEVVSPSKYVLQVHQVVTVLNSEGSSYLRHSLGFDKFYNVGEVAITMYNALGLPVKKYSKKDFEVQAAYDGFSLATDDKVMRLVTPAPSYPCTIDVRYDIKTYSYIELPDWYINTGGTSTEVFRYIVTVPDALGIRYRSSNFDLAPSVQTQTNKKVYTWEIKNIRAEKTQQGGFKSSTYSKRIEVAPNFFEYDGNTGNFSSWNEFGKWNFAL